MTVYKWFLFKTPFIYTCMYGFSQLNLLSRKTTQQKLAVALTDRIHAIYIKALQNNSSSDLGCVDIQLLLLC